MAQRPNTNTAINDDAAHEMTVQMRRRAEAAAAVGGDDPVGAWTAERIGLRSRAARSSRIVGREVSQQNLLLIAGERCYRYRLGFIDY